MALCGGIGLASAKGLSRTQAQRKLRRLYAGPIAKQGTLGVYIKRLGGRVLFARKGAQRLHPASCVKLITGSAVLRALGEDFRFDTVLRGQIGTQDDPGKLGSPLYLWGQGDPGLSSADLARFAQAVKARGIKAIPEGIVVDDSYFDRRRFPPGFVKWSSSAYNAPTGAVSIDGNTVEVAVAIDPQTKQPQVQVVPASDYIHVSNQLKLGARTRMVVTVAAYRGKREVLVTARGTFNARATPKHRQWVRILHPALYAGHTLKRELTKLGITVGEVKRGTVRPVTVLVRHKSKPLRELVAFMNQHSNNFYAEQLIKALGAKQLGAPGSTRKGIRAARGLMRRSRVGSYAMANGSGLFGRTRISAKQLVRLLERLSTLSWLYKAMRDSLPIAGRTGTLSKRMHGTLAVGRVRAKTGTFRETSCLAGYVDGRPGSKPLVFAIVHNGFKLGQWQVRQLQDKMVRVLARYLR